MGNRVWDPRDPAVLHDQRQAYDDMRGRCPVAHSDLLGWSLFRHRDLMAVLADPETFNNGSGRRAIPNGMDPPEHTVYRKLLEPYFSTEQMDDYEPECRQTAGALVQGLLGRGETPIELVTEYAEPYPLISFCAYLGWPVDRWEQLRDWNRGNQQVASASDRELGKQLAATFAGYVGEALDARRAAGRGAAKDNTRELMSETANGAPLTDEDIVSILRNWTAGHSTVTAGLANIALYLAQHPEPQQQLRDDPGLLPAAIDEILRVDGPLVMNRRAATRDVSIGGREIERGQRLALMWIAANRDDEVFDEPNEVRLDRDPEQNLVFGWGIHDCVGAPMARLELRVAVEELLARTSRIELAGGGAIQRASHPSNGVSSLLVTLR